MKLARGVCPVCGRNVALRKGRVVREHRPSWQLHGPVCKGSGKPALMVERALMALKDTGGRYPRPWTFDESMREISGMGGGYEAACRAMLKAGGEWADAHRDEHDFELFTRARDLPQDMQDVMVAAAEPGGATGAMFGTVASHIVWVYRNSWEAWVDRMRADLRDELAGGTELHRG